MAGVVWQLVLAVLLVPLAGVFAAVDAGEREAGSRAPECESHLKASSICARAGSGETRPSGSR